MKKKIIAIIITILILTSVFLVFNQNISSASTSGPSKISIYTGPTSVLADNNSYRCIFVQLQDSIGQPSRAQQDTPLSLTSSQTNIGTVDPSITIPKGATFASANFNSTLSPGQTTITAAATNYYATVQITTIGPIPSTIATKLAVYCAPATFPCDRGAYDIIQVQLQDDQGRPANAAENAVSIRLFSSDQSIGDVSQTLTIPIGQTQATGTLTVTNAPGTILVTAQASNYTTGQKSITTYLIDYLPLQITVTANPTSVNNGLTSAITAYVSANGAPVTGATVTFSSNNGGSFGVTTEQGNGYYNTSFIAPSFTITTSCTITASGSKTGYLSAQGTAQVMVVATPASTPTPTPSSALNAGTLAFCIKDSHGNPLSDVIVSSIAQPSGMSTLSEISNATGYVTFQNATAGTYTFSIVKLGYSTQNETLDYNALTPTLNIALTGTTSSDENSGNAPIVIIVVVVIVAVAAVVVGFFVKKRVQSPNVKKLQQLKKQMKPKFQT